MEEVCVSDLVSKLLLIENDCFILGLQQRVDLRVNNWSGSEIGPLRLFTVETTKKYHSWQGVLSASFSKKKSYIEFPRDIATHTQRVVTSCACLIYHDPPVSAHSGLKAAELESIHKRPCPHKNYTAQIL